MADVEFLTYVDTVDGRVTIKRVFDDIGGGVYVERIAVVNPDGSAISAGGGGGGGATTIADGADIALGATADTSATTDTGTFSLIALFKRFLAKITASSVAQLGARTVAQSPAVNMATDDAILGATNETAPASDTAAAGHNGRLQRIAQNLTTAMARAVAQLGGRTVAQSPAVNIATDDPMIGAKVTAVTALGAGGSGIIGWLSQVWDRLNTGVAIIAGTATIGAVVSVPRATANGSTSSRIVAAATTNATLLKASAGNLMQIDVFNVATYDVFLKLYDKASSPTVGTDTPVWTIPIKSGGGYSRQFAFGKSFPTGICYAITKLQADSDTTVIAALDVVGSMDWI